MMQTTTEKIQARCSHFGVCGGCQSQDISYDQQLIEKHRMLKEALGNISYEVEPFVPSPDVWFYRNKMEFVFSQKDGEALLGLHERGHWDRVVNVEQCFLLSERTNRILEAVRAFAKSHGLSAYDGKSHKGFLRHLVIREGKNTQDLMVHLVTAPGQLPGDLQAFTSEILRVASPLTSLLWSTSEKKADVAIGQKTQILYGEPHITETLMGLSFRISPYSFFQTNSRAAELLYKELIGHLEEGGALVDLYSGSGGISLCAASRVHRVFGIESEPSAVEDSVENARQNRIRNVEFICKDAGKALLQFLGKRIPIKQVVCDPPRAGLGPKVISKIAALSPRRILYVSCNPKALATDLALLAPRYAPVFVKPFDLFPHTSHVEALVVLELK